MPCKEREMATVQEAVQALLDLPGYTPTRLAAEVGASPASVSRWAAGAATPRPTVEGRLREILARRAPEEVSLLSMGHEPAIVDARTAIDAALGTLREALHRRGRLASRNEALDEISRLLFAHVMSQLDGIDGISTAALAGRSETTQAARLRAFVAEVHRRHLPTSITHELPPADFALRLKAQEDALAHEIIDCFERLHSVEATRTIGGARGIDILNDVFGKFLADSFGDEKELGQYLTPVEVVQYMVRLALGSLTDRERELLSDPARCSEFGTVLDPSCGVGSFLTEFLRTASTLYAPADDAGLSRWREVMCRDVVAGMDKSERMIRFALANMALFRFPAARLHLVNALALEGEDAGVTRSLDGTAGLILTNPPFGATFSGPDLHGYRIAEGWATRTPRSVDSELLFVERYIEWLRPGGQLLAIVPDSILTNKGLFEDLRRGIGSAVEVLTVTSLPPVTFASAGTSTKTSVLHLRKKDGHEWPRTIFAVCEDIGYTVATRDSRRSKQHTSEGDLPKILGTVLGWSDSADCRTVPRVEQAPRWDAGFHASLPLPIQRRIDAALDDDVRLGDIAFISTERVDPRRSAEPTFSYIEISSVDASSLHATAKRVSREDAPSRARKRVRAGDVLVSTVRPERRAVAVVRADEDGAVATTGFAVLTPTGIHPLVLAKLLQSDFVTAQLMRNNVGIAYPAIDESCLPSILLPIFKKDLSSLDAEADRLLAAEAALARSREAFRSGLEYMAAEWEGAIAQARLREVPDVLDR